MESSELDFIHIDELLGENELATIFVSDLHIGQSNSKHPEFLAYLKSCGSDIHKVVLCGDILDTWVSSIDTVLSEASPLLEFLFTNYGNGNLHYLLGNHDWALLPLKSFVPFFHISLSFPAGDKKAIALHGHLCDPDPYIKTKTSRLVAWLVNKIDKWAHIDTRKSLVSLSELIQNDPYDKLIVAYEQQIVNIFDGKYDYVITGHTHLFPYIKKLNNITFINLGDNCEHSTVLVAKQNKFYLFDYIAKKVIAVENITYAN